MSSTNSPVIESRMPFIGAVAPSRDPTPSRHDRLDLNPEWRRGLDLLHVFDVFACGALLLTPSGRVDRLNRSAEGHLDRGLILIHDRLRAQARDGDDALQQLIADAIGYGPLTPDQAVAAIPRPERRPLVVHAIRLAPRSDLPSYAVLALLDLDKPQAPSERTLRKTFGLTASEARLAIGIAEGRDMEAIAAASNVRKETLRSQLKAVFAKTGTHRQAELMGLLGRLAMIRAHEAVLPD